MNYDVIMQLFYFDIATMYLIIRISQTVTVSTKIKPKIIVGNYFFLHLHRKSVGEVGKTRQKPSLHQRLRHLGSHIVCLT